MSSTVALAGYNLSPNYGDELMFALTAHLLPRNSSIRIVSPSNSFMKNMASPSSSPRFEAVDESLSEDIDLLLFIGGGYFGLTKVTEPLWQLKYEHQRYVRIAAAAVGKGIPYHIVGPEVGPLLWPILSKAWRPIFDRARSISVRNAPSAKCTKQHFGKDACVIGDIVLGLTESWFNSLDYKPIFDLSKSGRWAGVHLTQKIIASNYLSNVFKKELCSSLIKSEFTQIVLFYDQPIDLDLSAALEIKDVLVSAGKTVQIVRYSNIVELTNLLRQIDVVFTTKLHVGVVSLSFGNYAVSFGTHPKIKRFYDEVGLSNSFSSFLRPRGSFAREMGSHLAAAKEWDHNYLRPVIRATSDNYHELFSYISGLP